MLASVLACPENRQRTLPTEKSIMEANRSKLKPSNSQKRQGATQFVRQRYSVAVFPRDIWACPSYNRMPIQVAP